MDGVGEGGGEDAVFEAEFSLLRIKKNKRKNGKNMMIRLVSFLMFVLFPPFFLTLCLYNREKEGNSRRQRSQIGFAKRRKKIILDKTI